MGWGPGCWWGGGYWFGGPLGIIFAVLFWAVVFLGVGYLVSALIRQARGQAPAGRETPIEILKRRFAAGEISEEEFKRMRTEVT
jgi:putative membrane protein